MLVYLPARVSLHICPGGYDLEGASSKLIMLDSGCCVPPDEGAALISEDEEAEGSDAPIGPPAGLAADEDGSRPVGRSG